MTAPRRATRSQPPRLPALPDSLSELDRVRRAPDPPPQAPPGTAALQAALPVAPASALAPGGVGSGTQIHPAGQATSAPSKPRLLARHAAPTDLFSPDAWQLVLEKLPERVASCQQRLCGFTGWFYRDDSEPFWGPATTRCCSGTALRGLWIWKPQGYSLRDLLGMEIERAARLMVAPAPGHGWAEGLVALLGTLRRIGQVYRELRWRCGERRALRHLADLLFTLPP